MSQSLASDKANIMLFPSLIPLRGSYNALLKAHNCFGLSYDVRPGNIRFTCSLLVSAPPHTYYASPPKNQPTYNYFLTAEKCWIFISPS